MKDRKTMAPVSSWACAAAIGAFIALSALPPPAAGNGPYESIGLIHMFSHEDWSTHPAVRSGTGTAADPFVVSGWSRDITGGGNGTDVHGRDVDDYLVVRGLYVFGDGVGPHLQCCRGSNWDAVSNASFEGNLIEKARMGFYGQDLVHDAIIGNAFLQPTAGAVRLWNARAVTIANNTVDGSGAAVIVLGSSTGVRVFHNTFLNNSWGAQDDAGTANAWDDGYPSGGNYWSNYNGTDLCKGVLQDDCSGSDGIGDTPYVIDADSQDRYPLMGPYAAPNRPPEVILQMSPSVPSVNETVTFNASASDDPDSASAVLEFRWDLDGDGSWELDWGSNATPSTTYATGGNHSISVQARDSGGATTNATLAFVVADPSLPDPHPAIITFHAPPAPQVGQGIVVETQVEDPDGIATVQVVYRGVSGTTFASATMTAGTGNTYTATLPPQPAGGTIDYYFVVTDVQGHQARDPPQGTHALTVKSVPQTPEADWQILTVVALAAGAAGAYVVLRSRRR